MRREGNKIIGEGYRITILTDRLLRLEYEQAGHFTDEKTIRVINREFPEVEFEAFLEDGKLHLETAGLSMLYDEGPFTSQGMQITLKESGVAWNYGDPYIDTTHNLGGTARTLDISDGPIPLEKGLFSKLGCTLLDDSDSCLLIDGEVVERQSVMRSAGSDNHMDGASAEANSNIPSRDLYFFAYGKDYAAGLKAFAQLTGKTPMLPRYALGNWWSKYEKYTEDSYMELLQKFEQEQVPLSVAVIDMDWHLTQIDPKYGNGWTGFTWNPEYFPDYQRFFKKLHDKGMAATLNLHPADGIRAFEAMYANVAARVGIDPSSEAQIPFDLSDSKFREAYFEEVLHPYEDAGVDFWWIDWQQGTRMGKTTCDPLWLCNHYHFEDQEKRGKRAMIFSRYAGWGSHRYPLGFSGDTKTTWASLNFQPYFTQTASNIGFGWWSHDIGGHMLGDKDLERYTRWVQFGVFSPIMRLHSSSSPFFVKEPWKIEQPYRQVVDKFMRLRHRLVPYLYTQNYISWKEDMPLVRPMYYENAVDPRSYQNRNEYWFGTSMIVGAITEKEDPQLRMAGVSMYLPEGTYFDLFTGKRYLGGMKRKFYRPLDRLPVFLPAGEIVPLAAQECTDASQNPQHIDLYIAPGRDGERFLYEDDGVSTGYEQGNGCITSYKMKWETSCRADQVSTGHSDHQDEVHDAYGKCTLDILSDSSHLQHLPQKRRYSLHLLGVEHAAGCVEEETGVRMDVDLIRGSDISIVIDKIEMRQADFRQEVFELLEHAWCEMLTKDILYDKACRQSKEEFLQTVREMEISTVMRDALEEILM